VSNKVFANGREISCKAAAGKTICAMPDVCFTPPENPATPPGVPVPYPNTGMASDTTDGSKNVKISNKEVGLKNKSCFKKSTGDEAGSAAKKGVITSTNTGKVFFESWSMDVKIEGQNAVRHLDLTTNNHASTPGDTPPWVYTDGMYIAKSDPECQKLAKAMHKEVESGLPESMKPTPGPGGSTLAVGKFFNGKPRLQASHSKILRGSDYSHYSKGKKRKEPSDVKQCDENNKNEGEQFEYADNAYHPNERHAEAKMIEDWFAKGAPGTLLIIVSKPVCPQCKKLIDGINKGPDGKGKCNKIKVCEQNQE